MTVFWLRRRFFVCGTGQSTANAPSLRDHDTEPYSSDPEGSSGLRLAHPIGCRYGIREPRGIDPPGARTVRLPGRPWPVADGRLPEGPARPRDGGCLSREAHPDCRAIITAMLRRKDGRTLHVRKATLAKPAQLKIYTVLGLDPQPGKTTRMVV